MKKLKVGFIMGGGVSMGSYSAGALSYMIKALEKHYDKTKYSSCCVDVFSGSSAGSAALAITVFEMIKGHDVTLELKKLWVDGVAGLDIDNLLPLNNAFDNKLEPSFLTTSKISKIMKRVFSKMPDSNTQPSSLLADEVRISMSLSNLNGIRQDARTHINNTGELTNDNNPLDPEVHDVAKTYWHNDSRRFQIKLKEDVDTADQSYVSFKADTRMAWKELGETARASGAFPFAFPPVPLKRKSSEYGRSWGYGDQEERWFHYVDGGVFNNQPLKFAMNMANELDKEEVPDEFERVFIVIDPIVGTEKADLDMENFCSPNKVEPDNYVKQVVTNLGSLVEMLLSHAQYKDWQKAHKINNQINWADKLIAEMVTASESFTNEVCDVLSATFHNALANIIREKYKATSQKATADISDNEIGIEKKIAAQFKIINTKYTDILEGIDTAGKRLNFLCYFIALVENVSGTRQKQKVRLIGIAPIDKRLTKGEFLSAFGGFFNTEWRAYDFKVGEYDAYKKLINFEESLVNKQGLQVIDKPLETPEISYKDAPESARNRFESYLLVWIRQGVVRSLMVKLKRIFRRLLSFGLNGFTKWVRNLIVKKIAKEPQERQPNTCIQDTHNTENDF